MKVRKLVAPALTALGVALAGCGSVAATPPATKAPALIIRVVTDPTTIGTYSPSPGMARVGDTVQWVFVDKNPHTVTSDLVGGFRSKVQANGKTFAFTFNTSGTFNYHCNIHPEMHGTVVVS